MSPFERHDLKMIIMIVCAAALCGLLAYVLMR
jgi:hypothetical protein